MTNVIFICDCDRSFICAFHWHCAEIEQKFEQALRMGAQPQAVALCIARLRALSSVAKPAPEGREAMPINALLPSEDDESGSCPEVEESSEEPPW